MSHSIGVFDSGIGGLTVMQQLVHMLPKEHFIYFGDTARLPYGEKSRETIIRYSIENAIFLLEQGIKVLVVACNTASAHALDKLQQIFNVPVVGVIEPGAESAIKATSKGKIAVLGTKGTIQSECYQKAIFRLNPSVQVLPIACPLFVPLVEEHFLEHPAARLIVQEYLKPLKESKIDTILLGCTHYPLLKSMIRQEIGEEVAIVDSALSCAEKVSEILTARNLHSPNEAIAPSLHSYFVSDDPHKFQLIGRSFLGMPIEKVSQK